MTRAASLFIALLGITLISCASQQSLQGTAPVQTGLDLVAEQQAQFPATLPADGLQPWEELDAAGHVVPADRSSSSININTDFTPGVERFLESGDAADNLEATRLNGTDSSGISYAMYRVTMGAEQPGIVSVDANLLSGEGYYVGLSNYGTDRWDWHGPFMDSHVRLQAVTDASGELTSALGNTFVTVLVAAGSSADVVGVGVNQYDLSDATAPATPLGLAATPVADGLLLEWSPVLDSDLAGYRILHSDASFSDPEAAGVHRVPYLEGTTRHLLGGLSAETFVAIQALDFGGNASEPGDLQSATPLAGEAGQLTLSASAVSGLVGTPISISASGESSYDWDLDGDGVFEVLADSEGQQQLDTSAAGIIRPRVRGTDSEAVALGGLSLLIGTNSRPLAEASADPLSGVAPLEVTFTGSADDLEDDQSELEFAWDFDGDGIYEPDSDTLTPDPVNYPEAGIFNARLRVTDTGGLFDTDPVAILATGNFAPVALLRLSAGDQPAPYNVQFDASSSADVDGSIVSYEWDWDNDGTYDENTGTEPMASHLFEMAADYSVTLRITDDMGSTDTDSLSFTATGWMIATPDDSSTQGPFYISLAVINGKPAIAYQRRPDYDLAYLVSSTATGSLTADWSEPVIVDSDGQVGQDASLVEVDGHPAIAYTEQNVHDLMYVRSTTPLGAQAADWSQIVTVDSAGIVGYAPCLAVVAGNPAISYQNNQTTVLKYARSNTSTGSMAEDWDTILELNSGSNAGVSSLRVVDGRPSIAFGNADGLNYMRSSTATGSTLPDWGSAILVQSMSAPLHVDIILADGNPAVSAYEYDAGVTWYARADTPDGGMLSDWQVAETLLAAGNPDNYLSLALVNGFPAISHIPESGIVQLATSSTATGLPAAAWENFTAVPEASAGLAYTSMAEVDGKVAIAYGDQSAGFLKYAIRFD